MFSDKRKWLPYLSDVDAIVFMAPLSQYDGVSVNSDGSNQLRDALGEFASLVHLETQWFQRNSIILMLNGVDKFKEKLPLKPVVRLP